MLDRLAFRVHVLRQLRVHATAQLQRAFRIGSNFRHPGNRITAKLFESFANGGSESVWDAGLSA